MARKKRKPAALFRCKFLVIKWSQQPGSNRRPTVYKTVALPLSYAGTRLAPAADKESPGARAGAKDFYHNRPGMQGVARQV